MITDRELKQLRLTEAEVRLAAGLQLYQDGTLTLAVAARLAGIDREEFLGEMLTRGISLNYSEEDLADDLQFVRSYQRP